MKSLPVRSIYCRYQRMTPEQRRAYNQKRSRAKKERERVMRAASGLFLYFQVEHKKQRFFFISRSNYFVRVDITSLFN